MLPCLGELTFTSIGTRLAELSLWKAAKSPTTSTFLLISSITHLVWKSMSNSSGIAAGKDMLRASSSTNASRCIVAAPLMGALPRNLRS